MTTPQQRAHRILRYLQNFDTDRGTLDACAVAVDSSEVVLGIYRNCMDGIPDVVVTDKAVHLLLASSCHAICYESILDVSTVEKDLKQPTGIEVVLRDGTHCFLPIRGIHNGHYDAFEFMRFLMRVKGDLSKATLGSRAANTAEQ